MPNIALNKPILESGWTNPECLTDGNHKVYDGTNGFAYSKWPAYLTVDLGGVHEIETIRFLLWDMDSREYKYRLLTSTDSVNWTVHFDTSETGYRGWQEFSFPKKTAIKYIRIHCLWNSMNEFFHVVQFQVFDSETEQLEKNISNNKVLTESNTVGTEINDGLSLTQKMNDLINRLNDELTTSTMINREPFQEIVNNLKIQLSDIASIERSMDSIRREIINPVKNELEEGKRLGKFSVWGFYIGFIGIIVSIFAVLNGIFGWV